MKTFLVRPLAFVLSFVFSASLLANAGGRQAWEYNPGPDPASPSGRALVDLYAELPEYMVMSDQLMESQKFRFIFGMMMTRTLFNSDAVKVLFVGQDATHIAEAAKQPGTSGFGARVQSIGNFFGVDQSVATTNAFLSTIKGQYGSFDHVFVEMNAEGQPQIRQSSFVDNGLWLLANGRDSEVLLKREAFWEWMIKNNSESMRLMILFGGAARDAFAEFLVGRGAKVGAKFSDERLKSIRVPETKLVFAGGNNEFPVPVTKDGKDIYEIILGRKVNYKDERDQQEAVKALKSAGQRAIDLMVFTGGGIHGSGIVNAAQLGGYNLEDVEINGRKTNSLKGLVLSDGTVVTQDIGFTMSAHPSSLSKMSPAEASAALKKSFSRLDLLKEKGWVVEPDLDDNGKPRRNLWNEGKDYDYGRADIRAGYFEFGAPDDRRVSRADASRLDPQTIIAGSRDNVKFDNAQIDAAKKALPSEPKNPEDLWSVRPRTGGSRYVFDRGPGEEIAKALVSSLDRDVLFEPKPGMKVIDQQGRDTTFETHGIDAFYTKTHPGTGLFGFHRGSFETSRALILADPQGLDDWNTSRALTGARGQYLNGLMRDLKIGEDYLVVKTVPVGMDGATPEEWEVVRQRTEKYREVAIRAALASKKVEVIFTDGDIARVEMMRVLSKLGVKSIPVIDIHRDPNDLSAGLVEAGREAQKQIVGLADVKISGKMVDIPRAHLPWWSRIWEGTSGDRVFDATGKARGGVRALVAPDWVVNQQVKASPRVARSISKIKAFAEESNIRLNESVKEFLVRRHIEGKFSETLKGVGPHEEAPVKPGLTTRRMTPFIGLRCDAVFAVP